MTENEVIKFQDGETVFFRLNKLTVDAAINSTVAFENIKTNLKRPNIGRFTKLPEFMKVKGNEPIAIVGGGPSVKDHLDDIKSFTNIISAGSVHDWLIDSGVIPTYASVCDPDKIMCNYMQKHRDGIKYLLASACDPAVYELLKDREVHLWHCHSDDYQQKFLDLGYDGDGEGEYHGVGGGCTVGLRSISLAMLMGYRNIHLFGYDSCLGEADEHHAYEFTDETQEQLGQIYTVRPGSLDKPTGKAYKCAGYHVAQTENFREFFGKYYMYFEPTFHGTGLLPDTIALVKEQDAEMLAAAQYKLNQIQPMMAG